MLLWFRRTSRFNVKMKMIWFTKLKKENFRQLSKTFVLSAWKGPAPDSCRTSSIEKIKLISSVLKKKNSSRCFECQTSWTWSRIVALAGRYKAVTIAQRIWQVVEQISCWWNPEVMARKGNRSSWWKCSWGTKRPTKFKRRSVKKKKVWKPVVLYIIGTGHTNLDVIIS